VGTSVENNREQYKNFIKKQQEQRDKEDFLKEVNKSKEKITKEYNAKKELKELIDKMSDKEVKKLLKEVMIRRLNTM